MAAEAMAIAEKTRPTAILRRLVMPLGWLVKRRAKGTRSFSLREVKRRMPIKRKQEREPEGTTKEPRLRSMKVACSIEKVVIWE